MEKIIENLTIRQCEFLTLDVRGKTRDVLTFAVLLVILIIPFLIYNFIISKI